MKYLVVNPVDWNGEIVKSGSIETDENNDADIQPLVKSGSLVLDREFLETDRVAKEAADKAEADRVAKEAADKVESDRIAKEAADKKAATAASKKAAK